MPLSPLISGPGTASTLTIGGSSVSMPRTVTPIRLRSRARFSVPTFTFQVRGGSLPTSTDPYLGQEVVLAVNGTTRFKGNVRTLAEPTFTRGVGWVRTYQCLGLEDRANQFPHTDSNTGLESSAYNVQADNQSSDYLASRAGRTVGEILTDVLTMTDNATALNAAGIGAYTSMSPPTLPSNTTTDLAALTLIPQAPVYFGGPSLWQAIMSFLQTWAPNSDPWIDPATGEIRVGDLRTYTDHTLTYGSDPITISGLGADLSDTAGRVVIRGEPIAEMGEFRTTWGNLSESPFAHDGLTVAQAKAAWTPSDWQQPGLPAGQAQGAATIRGGAVTSGIVDNQGYGYSSAPSVVVLGDGTGATYTATLTGDKVTALTKTAGGSGYTYANFVIEAPTGSSTDSGTCTCPTTTTVTVTSLNQGMVWGSNYWDQSTGKHGTVMLYSAVTTGVNSVAQRLITANTSLSAGGTSTLTVDRALPHTAFDNYTITGSANTAAAVWRVYGLPSGVGSKAAPQTTYPFNLHLASGGAVTQTSTPMGSVLWSYTGNPPYAEVAIGIAVDPVAETVTFAVPTYITAGNQVPTIVRAFVPINTGVNTVTYPPDSGGSPVYSGTAATYASRTLTVTVRSWRDPANASAMLAYAQDLHDCVKDVHREGTVTYFGLYETGLMPGVTLSLAGNGYTTSWESVALPVVETELAWNVDTMALTTVMRLSNRRWSLSETAYLHPDRTGLTFAFSGELAPVQVQLPFDLGTQYLMTTQAQATNEAQGGM